MNKKQSPTLKALTLKDFMNTLTAKKNKEEKIKSNPEPEVPVKVKELIRNIPLKENYEEAGKTLNPEQKQIFYDILHNFFEGEKKYAVIVGYAGTGKTYLISKSREALDKDVEVAMSAPTNKACKILADNCKDIKADIFTIHKLLALKMRWLYPPKGSKEKPKQVLTQAWNAKPSINKYSVLIVDEVSMLADELFDKINEEIEDDLKVIFMGDPAQIPPVSDIAVTEGNDAIPLMPEGRKEYDIHFYELKQIMRQKDGNTIVDLAYRIRTKRFENGDIIKDLRHSTANVKFYSPLTKLDFYTKMLDEYNSESYKKDSDYVKVLAWTNVKVNFFNNLIRSSFYGREADTVPYSEGEKLIADTTIMDSPDIIFNTSDEFTILEVEPATYNYTLTEIDDEFDLTVSADKESMAYRFNYWKCVVEDSRTKAKKQIRILNESSKQPFNFVLSKLKKNQRWQEWTRLIEYFAKVKYAYAITCHKAQGSTYGKVFLLEDDIDLNRRTLERNRIKYTACTRAQIELNILSSRNK